MQFCDRLGATAIGAIVVMICNTGCATAPASQSRLARSSPDRHYASSNQPPPQPRDLITNSIGMQLALIPAGQFMMGSPLDEVGREEDERPHPVTISRSFRLSTTEVTQAQWSAVMGPHPSHFAGDDRPVEEVAWNDAVTFCQKLSQKEGQRYRLPTEAEWEYACRAGATGPFHGPTLDVIAWHDGNSGGQTHASGTRQPNAWGLFDTHGNVAEWCADYFASQYGAEPATDPTGPPSGKARVIRGGSWASFARGCRSASRSSAPENYQLKFVGFRVVQEVPAQP